MRRKATTIAILSSLALLAAFHGGGLRYFGRKLSSEAKSAQLECPRGFLTSLLKDDRKPSFLARFHLKWGIPAPEELCPRDPHPESVSTPEMEYALAASPLYSVGAAPDLISDVACLARNSETEENRKIGVAKYYYFMSRLRDGAVMSLQELASLNAVLGLRATDGHDCDAELVPDAVSACETLDSCRLDDAAEAAKRLLPVVQAYIGLKKLVESAAPSWEVAGRSKQDRATLERARDLLEIMREVQPALKDREIVPSDGEEPSIDRIADGLRMQAADEKKMLVRKLDRIDSATRCLGRSSAKCKLSAFMKTVAEDTPKFELPPRPSHDLTELKSEEYLNIAACRYEIALDRDRQNTIAKDAAEGILIAAMPLGFGYLGTILGVTSNGAAGASRAATLAKIATKAVKAIMIGSRLSNSITSIARVIDQCRDNLEFLDDYRRDGAYCDSGARYARVVSNVQECAVARVMAVAGFLPWVPSSMGKYVQGLDLAQTASGRATNLINTVEGETIPEVREPEDSALPEIEQELKGMERGRDAGNPEPDAGQPR